jgi:phospholipase D1/2
MGKMGGKPWVVGAVPHMFRKRLMGKHLGDYRCDLTDPICDEIYRLKWLHTARENTSIYNELDGPCSYDKCNTLEEYGRAILERPFLSASDPLVESFLARLQGHLVMFPLRFLYRENLKSLAHSTVLPDELFA